MRFMADVAVADVSAAHHVVWVPRREEHDGHPTWLIPLEFGERFARDIGGSKLVVFGDLGHVPHEEDPARTVAEVKRFLGM